MHDRDWYRDLMRERERLDRRPRYARPAWRWRRFLILARSGVPPFSAVWFFCGVLWGLVVVQYVIPWLVRR